MLILGRKLNERILVKVGGVTVTVTVTRIQRGQVGLGFDAPPTVTIVREELAEEGDNGRANLQGNR